MHEILHVTCRKVGEIDTLMQGSRFKVVSGWFPAEIGQLKDDRSGLKDVENVSFKCVFVGP